MKTLIIISLIAIITEAGRRYFINHKLAGLKLNWWNTTPGLFMAFLMFLPLVWRNWTGDGMASSWCIIAFWFVVAFLDLFCTFILGGGIIKKGWHVTVFIISIFIPLIIIIFANIFANNKLEKEFEAKWQETEAITIKCQPLKTIVSGNETVVLECEEQPQDISFGVNTYGFDVLKLQESDKIKYLKIGSEERFEIITLKGQPYKKH